MRSGLRVLDGSSLLYEAESREPDSGAWGERNLGAFKKSEAEVLGSRAVGVGTLGGGGGQSVDMRSWGGKWAHLASSGATGHWPYNPPPLAPL